MSSKSRWLLFLISTPLVVIATVGGLIGSGAAAKQGSIQDLRVFQDVVSLTINNYVEPVSVDKIFEGAMHGLTDGMDPESAYLTPDEVALVQAKTPLGAADVGLTVTRQYYLRVMGVRDGSPAARAGLRTNDFVRAIDGKSTRDMSAFTGTRLLHGDAASKVSLTVLRGNAAEPHVVELTRETPSADTVTSRKLDTGEMYVHIASFAPGAAAALHTQLDAAKQAGATRAVIDLRGTSTGSIDEAITAARLFVATGTIAIRAGRENTNRVDTKAEAGDGAITMPLVLLVSSGTSDAAEVFASALDGNHRADLVGEQTAGLAGVQRLVTLPDGSGLWMTYERYLTTSAEPILERGLAPDVPVEIPTVAFEETPPTSDVVLAKALERLKAKKAA